MVEGTSAEPVRCVPPMLKSVWASCLPIQILCQEGRICKLAISDSIDNFMHWHCNLEAEALSYKPAKADSPLVFKTSSPLQLLWKDGPPTWAHPRTQNSGASPNMLHLPCYLSAIYHRELKSLSRGEESWFTMNCYLPLPRIATAQAVRVGPDSVSWL
jgi:hypothetical protein